MFLLPINIQMILKLYTMMITILKIAIVIANPLLLLPGADFLYKFWLIIISIFFMLILWHINVYFIVQIKFANKAIGYILSYAIILVFQVLSYIIMLLSEYVPLRDNFERIALAEFILNTITILTLNLIYKSKFDER